MLNLFNSPQTDNKINVIELYCRSDEYVSQVDHEIITGTDFGPILTAEFGQDVRFVYAPDYEKYERIKKEAESRGYTQTIINLYEPDNVTHLISRLRPGDSIYITAQTDIDNGLVAGLEADDLVDVLLEELELKDIPLNNLDLGACMIGRVDSYREALRHGLNNFQTITTYTDLCSATYVDGKPRRIWIEERTDGDVFYDESELDTRGSRIVEYTQAYKASLK